MLKRAIDIVCSAAGLLALLPIAVVVAVAVKATSMGPALYWSDRIGRHGRVFRMPKFRTMLLGTPALATDKLVDPRSRLTPIGGFLRATSLDEIPQLWSIMCGDMSIVGPRPALFNQHDLIERRRALGIDVLRPGLTGWAQVNGRDHASEDRKIELDAEYLSKASFGFDIRIIGLTVWRVLRGDGVSH
jgi:O-antigen biosynthesis protein WbqP